MGTSRSTLFRRHIALPTDHGSWVFLLSPLLIGLFAGESWSIASFFLVTTSLAVFLLRQPASTIVKIYSGRRSTRELSAAVFWLIIYTTIGTIAVIGLVFQGYAYLLILGIPGVLVFSWYMILISQRAERRQAGVEIIASGVLALTAPAAYWIGIGSYDPIGWMLWLLTWSQSAASIIYAYLRLEQRQLKNIPDRQSCLKMGQRALLYSTFNLTAVIALSIFSITPVLLPFPYLVQWLETIWGTFNPAIGVRPTTIGIRQLIISIIFTILFIITWKI